MPLPGIIIAELGLDSSEIHRFNGWAGAMVAGDVPVDRRRGARDRRDRTRSTTPSRRGVRGPPTDPTDDLISTLVHAHEDEDGVEPLSVAELQNLMHQLVTGGFETTTSALNHGMWLLTRIRTCSSVSVVTCR